MTMRLLHILLLLMFVVSTNAGLVLAGNASVYDGDKMDQMIHTDHVSYDGQAHKTQSQSEDNPCCQHDCECAMTNCTKAFYGTQLIIYPLISVKTTTPIYSNRFNNNIPRLPERPPKV